VQKVEGWQKIFADRTEMLNERYGTASILPRYPHKPKDIRVTDRDQVWAFDMKNLCGSRDANTFASYDVEQAQQNVRDLVTYPDVVRGHE
jgi:hypothetical protein